MFERLKNALGFGKSSLNPSLSIEEYKMLCQSISDKSDDSFEKISVLCKDYIDISYRPNEDLINYKSDFDKFVAYFLGVIEWANVSLLCEKDDSNEIKTERFRRFVKYYCVNRLDDTNFTMASRLMMFVTEGLFIKQRKIGFDAINSRNEVGHEPHMFLRKALNID